MLNLNSKSFKNLVESVYLSGIIDACVLEVNNCTGTIQSIDKLNCLFVSNNTKITDDDKFKLKIGFSDLSSLYKILNNLKEGQEIKYNISKDTKWLNINIKGKGKLRLLLVEPDELSTAVEGDDIVTKLMENVTIEVEITDDVKQKILYFLNMFKDKIINFVVDNKELYVQSHGNDGFIEGSHHFKVSLGEVESEDVTIEINGTYFLTVLSYLNEKATSKIHIGDGVPVIIDSKVDDDNYIWAFSPISMG